MKLTTKYTKKLLGILPYCLLPFFTGCADDDMVQMNVQEPSSLSSYDYLKDYGVLKNYDGRIGVIMAPDAFMAGGMEYRIGVSNFSEIVPEGIFSHAKAVKANGSIDSTSIAKIRKIAENVGVSFLGTPLVWHEKQNTTYLASQISANVIRPEGDDGGYCLKMTNTAKSANANDAQVNYTFAKTPRVEPGITYKLKMMVRGTAEGKISVQTYSNSRGSKFKPDITITKEWKMVEATNTISAGIKGLTSILFCLGEYVGTIYVDDIELVEWNTNTSHQVGKNLNTVNTNLDDAEQTAKSISIQTNTNSTLEDVGCSELGEGYDPLATYVEKTDAEKRAILTAEMKKYISGVMAIAKNSVNDWVVVKDPLAEDDGDASKFYWQSYLGNADYAVTALNEAAQHTGGKLFVEQGGLDCDLSLCQQFVNYVSTVEGLGAKVDGVAVSINADTELTNIDDISQMFKLLASTGKLVRISDLKAGIAELTTNDSISESMYKQQAELLGNIIKAYNENVPEAQQGGITLHQVFDDVYPYGLWTTAYQRKHAYGGVAEALR